MNQKMMQNGDNELQNKNKEMQMFYRQNTREPETHYNKNKT